MLAEAYVAMCASYRNMGFTDVFTRVTIYVPCVQFCNGDGEGKAAKNVGFTGSFPIAKLDTRHINGYTHKARFKTTSFPP